MSSKKIALMLTDIGQAVRLARKSQKLSQAQLGEKAGLSRMPIYRIESGHDVSLRTLLSILSALRLGVQLQSLPQGIPTAADLREAFAHLHEELE